MKKLLLLAVLVSISSFAQINNGGGAALATPGSSGLCLVSNGNTSGAWAWGACSGTTSTNWSALTADLANTSTGTFQIGNGTTLGYVGTGVVQANKILTQAISLLFGNSGKLIQATGTFTNGNLLATDANGNAVDAGAKISDYVPKTTTVAGKALSGNITLALGDLTDGNAAGIVGKFGSGTCSGYLKSDGTCDTGTGGLPTLPTSPDGVAQTVTSTPSGGVGGAAAWALPGVATNAQTGTTYTVLATDRAKYLTFSNASSIAVTLPQAGSTGFASSYTFKACTIGAGTATITPTTSTISYTTGSAYQSAQTSLALTTGQCATIYSDNTNYFANVFSAGGAGNTTNALTADNSGSGDASGMTFNGSAAKKISYNTLGLPASSVIANVTSTNPTTAVGANACSAAATTVAMTGLTTSMTLNFTPSSDPSGSAGWGSTGGLTIAAWPTANQVNYKICNQTGSSITPGAITWNISAR